MKTKTVFSVVNTGDQSHVKTLQTWEKADAYRTAYWKSAFDIVETQAILHDGILFVPNVITDIHPDMLKHYRNNIRAIEKAEQIKSELSEDEIEYLIEKLKL